jgi:hypothetical protein
VPTAILCATLWRSPFPLSETVALLEDVADRPVVEFFAPATYYRPLFHAALSGIWHASDSVDTALRSIRLLHIVPLSALVALFVWHGHPRRAVDFAASTIGVAVLIGSPGLLGNLELPLSYTIVGMPAALAAWIIAEREHRPWHAAALVSLLLLAIGFKEQGLVIAPLVIGAWAMKAPGVKRSTAIAVASVAVSYVAFRLITRNPSASLFEQDVGLGFGAISASDAEARFRAFPWGIFAYNAASTVANLLFAEPTEGMFRITKALVERRLEPWHVVYLASSCALTGVIAWWAIRSWRALRETGGWNPDARLAVALVIALAASGALSFSYSRDRLAGMAVPFYAMTASAAVRAGILRAASAPPLKMAAVAALLVAVAASWQMRALYTIEFTRQRGMNSHREWITDLRGRRQEFAGRPTYVAIMEEMTRQGTAAVAVRPTRYPRWVLRLMGEL